MKILLQCVVAWDTSNIVPPMWHMLCPFNSQGLFRGVSINYIKAVPSTAIGFTVYDQLK